MSVRHTAVLCQNDAS